MNTPLGINQSAVASAQPRFTTSFGNAFNNVSPSSVTPSALSGGSGGFGGFSGSLLSSLPSLVSSGVAAFNQFQAFKANQSFANFLEAQTRIRQQAQMLETRERATDIRKEALKNAGKARALFAQRGIAGGGTAVSAIEKSISEGEEGAATAMNRGNLRAAGIEFQGTSQAIRQRLLGVNQLLNIGQNMQQTLLSNFPLSQ